MSHTKKVSNDTDLENEKSSHIQYRDALDICESILSLTGTKKAYFDSGFDISEILHPDS